MFFLTQLLLRSPWLWGSDCFSQASLASSVTWEGAIEQVQELNTAGPQITSFCSMTFHYNVDEMLQELFVNQPMVKLVSSYIVLHKVAEPIDDTEDLLYCSVPNLVTNLPTFTAGRWQL